MSQGTMCLTCRKYITPAEWGCKCAHPTPSNDGKTPIDAALEKERAE